MRFLCFIRSVLYYYGSYSRFLRASRDVELCIVVTIQSVLSAEMAVGQCTTQFRLLLLLMQDTFDLVFSSHFSISVVDFYVKVLVFKINDWGASDWFVCIVNTVVAYSTVFLSDVVSRSRVRSMAATLAAT